MAHFQGAAAALFKPLSIADARRGGSGLPSRIVFYGPPGMGKTSFAAYAPSPIFIMSPCETGVQTLIDAKLLPPELRSIEVPEEHGWARFLGLIDELTKADHDYRTVVIDTINGMEKLANTHVCQTEFEGKWGKEGFSGFSRGHAVVAGGEWLRMLAALDRMRTQRSLRIILLGHTTVSTINNPSGYDYSQHRPAFDGKPAWERTCEWADMVLFGTSTIEVHKDGLRAKATGGSDRKIHTEMSAGWVAKNRHGLPWSIEMGDSGKQAWDNFVQAVRDGMAAAASK